MISRFYFALIDTLLSFRHYCYKKAWIKQCKSHIPIISIGSITIGGAGKTPLTLFTAEKLSKIMRPYRTGNAAATPQ